MRPVLVSGNGGGTHLLTRSAVLEVEIERAVHTVPRYELAETVGLHPHLPI